MTLLTAPISTGPDGSSQHGDPIKEIAQLRRALASNRAIGKAIGLLMAQYHLDDDAAYEKLRSHSRDLNIKMRDLAIQIIDHHNEGCAGSD